MKNLTIGSLFKPFKLLFTKFHLTLFIIAIAAGLGGAVLLLNDMLANLSELDAGYTSSISAGTIDQSTLDRIKELHTSDEAVPAATLPSGRINPFGE
ncbi:MAG: hypothetical protein WAV04_01195 [Candidatus Microsaccharimonas sp.]|jgi:hypothetical protein